MSIPSPSLSISDLMHPLSPPPEINSSAKSPPLRTRSSTPGLVEPMELAEIEGMRKRVISMGYGESSKGKGRVNSKEQELADMLLRLTHPASLPQPSQLHAQAETIANLIHQRDFLVKRSAEERERWEAEREGWARAAQALLLRGRKELSRIHKEETSTSDHHGVMSETSSHHLQEVERINALFHSERKILQQKLTETQSRLAALESELIQLKPFLLFHHPKQLHPGSLSAAWSPNVGPSTPRPGATRWNQLSDYEADSDEETPRSQPRPQFRNPVLRPVGSELVFPTLQSSPQKYKGRRDVPSPALPLPPVSIQTPKTPRKKSGHVQITTSNKPLLSDARTEHLLLAARKIGMQRAAYLSGVYSQSYLPPEPPTPRKRRRTASPSKPQQTPKTPRRTANISTPLLTRTPLDTSSAQPRTPLQSLLTVAQSVLSDPGTHSLAPQESPLAKRRKIDHSSSPMRIPKILSNYKGKGKEKQSDADAPQFKSALDFLADQAEVYGSKSGSRERDEQPTTTQADLEMEDATGSTDHEVNADIPIPSQDQNTHSSTSAPERHAEDVPETQQTGLGSYSQDGSLSFIEELTSLPSHPVANAESNMQSKSPEDKSNLTASDSLSLAPAIDLTPAASHSPDPQDFQRRSRRSSRSHSVDRDSGTRSLAVFPINRAQTPPNHDSNGSEKSPVVSTPHTGDVKFIVEDLSRRARGPYTRWTKEEDELLVKAVARYGNKWDLVQKELPSRGYHQVRQRWLRRQGNPDNSRPDSPEGDTTGDPTDMENQIRR